MIKNAFEFLFVLSLVAPLATAVLGVLLLAWPIGLRRFSHISQAPSHL